MSVFKVDLNNKYQGYLDINPVTGLEFDAVSGTPSIQRTMYVAGPHGGVHKLADGATFTDCNYWKRFAYPQMPENQAFITVLTDDGSPWTNNPSDNTTPAVYAGTISSGTTTTVDFTSSGAGGFAQFAQISNLGSGSLLVALNAQISASFPLAGGSTQIFNAGDLNLGAVALSIASGSVRNESNYQILASVRSVCNT